MNITTLTFESAGQKISGVLTTPAESTRRIIILAHGGPGGNKQGPSDIFILLAQKLAEKNLASLRFDFRGSGESEGDFVNTTIQGEVNDLRASFDFVGSHGYQAIGLVGESLGGTISILGYDSRISVLALWFPAITLAETSFKELLTKEKLMELDQNGFIAEGAFRLGKPFIDEIQTISLTDQLENIKSPTLLIHGDKDKDVPYEQSLSAADLIRAPKRLEIIPGGEHGLRKPGEQEHVTDLTVSWFTGHMIE